MLLRPQINLLALLALSSFAQAHWFEDTLNEVYRRQADDASTGTNPSVTSPPDNASTSGSSSPSPTPSETGSTTTSVTTTPSSTSSLPSSTASNSLSTSTRASSTTTSAPGTEPTSSINPSKTTTQGPTKDGETTASVSESTSVAPSSTGTAELTDNNDSSGSGMSAKTKSTVIGVVVGIGGAILLAGLAVVAWRIWGRKKSAEEGDDLMDYGRPDTGAEKPLHSSGSNSTNPFQKTLENYHNPDRRLNASSNF